MTRIPSHFIHKKSFLALLLRRFLWIWLGTLPYLTSLLLISQIKKIDWVFHDSANWLSVSWLSSLAEKVQKLFRKEVANCQWLLRFLKDHYACTTEQFYVWLIQTPGFKLTFWQLAQLIFLASVARSVSCVCMWPGSACVSCVCTVVFVFAAQSAMA